MTTSSTAPPQRNVNMAQATLLNLWEVVDDYIESHKEESESLPPGNPDEQWEDIPPEPEFIAIPLHISDSDASDLEPEPDAREEEASVEVEDDKREDAELEEVNDGDDSMEAVAEDADEDFVIIKKPRCVCGKVFTTQRTMKRHQRSTGHETGVSIRVVCQFCEKKFTRRNYLRKHIRQQHNVNPNSSNVQLLEELSYNDEVPVQSSKRGMKDLKVGRSGRSKLRYPVRKRVTFVGHQQATSQGASQPKQKLKQKLPRENLPLVNDSSMITSPSHLKFSNKPATNATSGGIIGYQGYALVPKEQPIEPQIESENGNFWADIKIKSEPLDYEEDEQQEELQEEEEEEQEEQKQESQQLEEDTDEEERTLQEVLSLGRPITDSKPISMMQSDKNESAGPVSDKEVVEQQGTTSLATNPEISLPGLSCLTCNKHYASKKNLNRHIRETHGEKTLICKLCGLGFSRKYHLTRHMLRDDHTATKGRKSVVEIYQHWAPELEQTQPTVEDMEPGWQSSLYASNSRNSPKPVPVRKKQVSLKSTSKAAAWKRFLSKKSAKSMTGRKLMANKLVQKAKNKSKSVNKYRVVKRNADAKHENTPTSGQHNNANRTAKKRTLRKQTKSLLYPFDCTECGRSFMVKKSLKRHIKTKHKLDHLQCNICGYVFSSSRRDILVKHMKKQHPDVPLSQDLLGMSSDSLSDSPDVQLPDLEYYPHDDSDKSN
ncbi:PREDICTED: zinc finger protein 2-like [Priapulus caudatus]|uniref:Zinc finger protein 2-like n=1 Tax=Priapulus caudatus TaxID=37621 RepID=A0ABM1EDX8_PRICU|nr:PREDICTED: zinc finger protein 2-like [Priapulus caudatus]